MRMRRHMLLWAASCWLMVQHAQADTAAEKGRNIFETNKSAVVTVLLVINTKVSSPGRPSQEFESKAEATGTVINADGLTVVSLSKVDPSALFDIMQPDSGGMNYETEVRDAKILMEDNSEIDASVILRDRDLDMAFVRPKAKPETAFEYIDFSDSGEPALLDQVITINRLGQVARRAHAASVERIDAIVKRPRTFYIPGNDPTNTEMGSPAFTLDGKVVGVLLVRAIKSSGGTSGNASQNVIQMFLPAEDVLEAAEQAPAFEE